MYWEIIKWRTKHEGLDYWMWIPWNKWSIYSCTEWVVEFAWSKSWFGNTVVIAYNGYKIYYAHLDSILVKKLQVVKPMQEIWIMGNSWTGTWIHLHLWLMKDWKWIDPTPFIIDRPEKELEWQHLIDDWIFNWDVWSLDTRMLTILARVYNKNK